MPSAPQPKKRSSILVNDSTAVEWIGGIRPAPGLVIEADGPYTPDILMWTIPGGAVAGFSLEKPGEAVPHAAAHLRETLEKTSFADAIPRPSRLRVATPELASALRAAAPRGLEIVCAPTPELDDVMASMADFLARDRAQLLSYKSNGADSDRVAASFRAAATLYRAKPWKTLDSDAEILSVTSEALHLDEAAVSVIGQLGESLGFLVFESFADFARFRAFAVAQSRGDTTTSLPPHCALSFERKAEVDLALRKEVAAHGWELANASVYPSFVSSDGSLTFGPPTSRQQTQLDAIALGLSRLVATKDDRAALRDGFHGGAPFERTIRVETFDGPVELTFRAPHPAADLPREDQQAARALVPASELFSALKAAEAERDREKGQREIEELTGQLFVAFDDSPEGNAFPDAGACSILCEWLAEIHDVSIVSLVPEHLEELLFDELPRHGNVQPFEAESFVVDLRAFLEFLARAYRFAGAAECLRFLGPDTVQAFARELGDPRNFGPAKSILATGQKLGFDVSSPEGIEAFMAHVERVGLPTAMAAAGMRGTGVLSTRGKVDAKKAKAKRKAARAQRKKNR